MGIEPVVTCIKIKLVDILAGSNVMSVSKIGSQRYTCFKLVVSTFFSKIHAKKNSHHIETNQLIYIDSNQLTGFYMMRIFSERYSGTDYIHTIIFKLLYCFFHDLHYPESPHDLHQDYPYTPKSVQISQRYLFR